MSKRKQRGWAWLSWAVPAAMKGIDMMTGRADSKAAQRMQDHYINNAIGIRVADARRQGIHPLAALGANIQPGQAQQVMTGGGWGEIGQDLSRAFMQGASQRERDELAMDAARQAFRKGELEAQNLELQNEAARLQLNRLQQQVGPAAGYEIKPAQVTAANAELPSVEAGPAGPGFQARRIGYEPWDIGSSELSEWAEGAGLVGHGLVPFWMWQQAKAREMSERAYDRELAERGGDRAFEAASRELDRLGPGYFLKRVKGGWEIRKRGAYDDRTHVSPGIGSDVWKPRGGRFHRGRVE